MWLTEQYHAYKRRKEGLETYNNAVARLLQKATITDEQAKALNTIEATYGLDAEKTKWKRIELVKHVYRQSVEDKKLSEKELDRLNDLIRIFSLKKEDVALDHDELVKYSSINRIAKGELPDITEVADRIGITFASDEVLNGLEVAELMKLRKVTERVNYGGFSSSIRIMKGFRYRAGSFNVQRIHKEVLASEDRGVFWVSNQRLGFKGARTNVAIEWKKVASFELGEYGLMLFKQGKEKPYIFNLKDYDVISALASYYLNPEDRESGEEVGKEEELEPTPLEEGNEIEDMTPVQKSLWQRWYIKALVVLFVLVTFRYSMPFVFLYWNYLVVKKVRWHLVWKIIALFFLIPMFIGSLMALFQG